MCQYIKKNTNCFSFDKSQFLYIFLFYKERVSLISPPWNYLVTADFLIPEWMMDIKFVRTDL